MTALETVDVLTGEIVEERSLDELAALANFEHGEVVKAGEGFVLHAITCGEHLNQAKEQVGHGGWLPWLVANFSADERTARRYMQVASNRTRVSDLGDTSLRKALAALSDDTGTGDGAHVGNNSGEFEWYTPTEYIDAALEVMGGIDLDPASNREANGIVKAATFYAKGDDALNRLWSGRVWMNPPYSQPLIEQFIDKLVASYVADDVTEACVLVNNATDTAWFHAIAKVASAVCFTRGRVRFWHPDRDSSQPLQGQAVIYLGANVDEFRAVFARFGFTVVR